MTNQLENKYINGKQLPNDYKQMAMLTELKQKESIGLTTIATETAIKKLPEILFISSYPPKECGIATYTQDLVKHLNNKFIDSFRIKICPLESGVEKFAYTGEIQKIVNTDHSAEYTSLAATINENADVNMVIVQHEFGFFAKNENAFKFFLSQINKPVILVFHTVLPKPDELLKEKVKRIASYAESIVVMTNSSSNILMQDYGITQDKITVIPHGTHLVPNSDKDLLKNKYGLSGKKVLSTFGLLGSGKNIESTLEALPTIVKNNPDTLFLIIGKTHPSIINQEGEKYRSMLEAKVEALQLQHHVKFINQFLPLPELLDYLQLTDIYLFTSRNPNQAVSGTFSYAISSGCPVISTPIPHALEVLRNDAGIIIDFENPKQLAEAVNSLLKDDQLRKKISSNALHRMASTAWENAAIAHARLFEKISKGIISLSYELPAINLDHLKKITTDFGMIQFSKINHPDIESGFTLDDSTRALIAFCQHYEKTRNKEDLKYINIYFNFIKYCQQPGGNFLNYVNEQKEFTEQNKTTNLEDANGRAIWALGYMISLSNLLPAELAADAASTIQKALLNVNKIHSTRAMAFVIKGLYYRNLNKKSIRGVSLIRQLSGRLVQMYRHEADKDWQWFESYLTYANSVLPEAMLCAWLATGDSSYKDIARSTFDFLLSKTFSTTGIKVISNKNWLNKGEDIVQITNGGEQPIDVAYTILALRKFYDVFKDDEYISKMEIAFSWFLGNNHLHQVIYNPCTGGCYDGLEENNVNLNQGAESSVSYLMARLTVEESFRYKQNLSRRLMDIN